ncbi:hypothetical protein RHGRI_026714 [Rhododendron griersonianum]|uniref:Uncharacterized protein n=1 Tax=Rhododendron griersonianum TaxID=479676 RepID=A0AAV6IW33_9ERIC|nr:hypothetical protein RHGRI_026714 [Rhododendron griersonianum]
MSRLPKQDVGLWFRALRLTAYEPKIVFGLGLETANPNPNKVEGFVSSKLLGLFETSYMLLTLVDWAGSYQTML